MFNLIMQKRKKITRRKCRKTIRHLFFVSGEGKFIAIIYRDEGNLYGRYIKPTKTKFERWQTERAKMREKKKS